MTVTAAGERGVSMRDDIGGSPGGPGEPGGPRERQSWDTEVYNVGAPPPARRGAAPSGPVVPVGSAVLLGVSRGRPPAERSYGVLR